MKKVFSSILIFVITLSLFAGCSMEKKIVGTWSYQQTTLFNIVTERKYTFNADGTGTAPILDGTADVNITYTLEDDVLTIKRTQAIGEIIDSLVGQEIYTVKISGDKMTLTSSDGTVIELTKVQ